MQRIKDLKIITRLNIILGLAFIIVISGMSWYIISNKRNRIFNTFRGRAKVIDKWYLTACQPIHP